MFRPEYTLEKGRIDWKHLRLGKKLRKLALRSKLMFVGTHFFHGTEKCYMNVI